MIISVIFVLVVILGIFLQLNKKEESALDFLKDMTNKSQKTIREPAAAGQFYPADPEELKSQLNGFLDKAEVIETKGDLLALIVPHAGYDYSGQVAADGFKQLAGKKIETVILIGNSHQEQFDGISVFNQGYFKTPLGEIEIDTDLAEKIMGESQKIFFKESTHRFEHSLEVELPFLQMVLGNNFKIIPFLFGNSQKEDYRVLAEAIAKHIGGKNVLLVASSDLSHYPSYEDAQKADARTIKAILSGQVAELEKTIEDLEKENIANVVTFACGIDAIKTIMLVAEEQGIDEIKLLKYANSGDVEIGDKSQVVGYAAIGFFGQRTTDLIELNKEEQEELLTIARSSVETFIKTGKLPEFNVQSPALNRNLGAFVTIKKNNQLRGCIGLFSPSNYPLYQVVSQMAVAAATQDSRFLPVSQEELPELKYEISVLSDLEKIDDWQKIELAKHGVEIKQGTKRGVFLPQVARENNWDLTTFLSQLCFQKAGLPADCYKDKETEISIFTAQIFEEN